MKRLRRTLRMAAGVVLLAAGLAGCKPDDMANQPRYKPLAASPFYHDGSSARPLVPHTVPRNWGAETLALDTPTGWHVLGRWQNTVPAGTPYPFPITAADLKRGQQEFTIYCTPCHGQTGEGDGMIPQRGFTRPPTYHSDRLRKAPPAYFVNVITNGLGAMYPYNDRVSVEDRWRIAAYIKALQFSEHAPVDQLSPEDRQKLGEVRP